VRAAENAHRDLRASLSGKDVPEDVKSRLLALHEDNLNVKEQLKTTQDKLAKAKTVMLRFNQVFQLALIPFSSLSLKTNSSKKNKQSLPP
jgi:protein HOOK3